MSLFLEFSSRGRSGVVVSHLVLWTSDLKVGGCQAQSQAAIMLFPDHDKLSQNPLGN